MTKRELIKILENVSAETQILVRSRDDYDVLVHSQAELKILRGDGVEISGYGVNVWPGEGYILIEES